MFMAHLKAMRGSSSLNQEYVVSGLCEAPGDDGSRGARPHDDKVILRATQWWGLKELGHVEVVVVGGHDELRESAHCHGQCDNR